MYVILNKIIIFVGGYLIFSLLFGEGKNGCLLHYRAHMVPKKWDDFKLTAFDFARITQWSLTRSLQIFTSLKHKLFLTKKLGKG